MQLIYHIMEMHYSKYFVFFFYLCMLQAINAKASKDDERKVYIVFMGDLPEVNTNLIDDHHNLLMEAITDKVIAREALLYSYGRSFNGFAANLLPHEADKLSQNDNVVSVFLDTKYDILTTRSWDFLDMPINVPRNQSVESNIIIGLLDTGIYVPSKSFSDAGFGPPPKSWKGHCETGDNFTGCNKKVIGARYFDVRKTAPLGQRSPADYSGHGTHTSSIAAGVPVKHASLNGVAKGTARGGVPLARIAMYKVCSEDDCYGTDILAGFDAAIDDRVDIISVSLGGQHNDYLDNPIAIGSLYAVKKGILVTAAAGNDGTSVYRPIENSAPWIMTVAASTIDRVVYMQELIENYINSTKNPMAKINMLRDIRAGSRAPMVADFSSQGPDHISKRILKPDIAAPGDRILAAYSELSEDPMEYNILSGTSMATPHVASAAAYLKSFHPDWSPAILRSALMTTTKPMRLKPEGAELSSGAGNIDPIAALDPGLVYDINPDSYNMYNCSLQATNISFRSSKKINNCPNIPDQMGYDGLNYPSFHYQLNNHNETDIAATFHRNVTYLGQGVSEYNAIVDSPEGLFIKVEPENLLFNETRQQKSFSVILKGRFMDEKQWYLSGSIAWDDSVHLVKSPVLVYRPPSRFT